MPLGWPVVSAKKVMTTPLAFMISGSESKIEMPDVDNAKNFSAVKDELMNILAAENKAPKSKDQIRFIYSGKIINDTDKVADIVNPDIQPPYTLQIMIRPEGSTTPSNSNKSNRNSSCAIF